MFADKYVLVIDDSPTVCQYIRSYLIAEGSTVDVAFTGQEGLEKYATGECPNIILLDLLLPDLHGIQILEQIRETDDKTVIVVLTGMGDIKSAIAATQKGADGYQEKHDVLIGHDPTSFFYTIKQAVDHRTGLLAKQQLERQQFELALEQEKVKILASFVEATSHEFRTPLSGIILGLEYLERCEHFQDVEKYTERIGRVKEQVFYLVKLLDGLLTMSKLDCEVAFTFELANINDLLQIIEPGIKFEIDRVGHSFTMELAADLPPIQIDKEYLNQVILELVENAIHYTPEAGAIHMQTSVNGDYVVVAVRDTGMGIDDDALPYIFDRFYRVDEARSDRGIGLGLSIAKKIVDIHQGRIEVESELGTGTEFRVLLPVYNGAS